MKKQPGFTLIELMVVMAIIAILATAGLSAYTGYLRKARDATRIADLSDLYSIALGSLDASGRPPTDAGAMASYVRAANNGVQIRDPLSNTMTTPYYKSLCGPSSASATNTYPCVYHYSTCESGAGFNFAAAFESPSNYATASTGDMGNMSTYYEVGNCQSTPSTYTSIPTTNSVVTTDSVFENDGY